MVSGVVVTAACFGFTRLTVEDSSRRSLPNFGRGVSLLAECEREGAGVEVGALDATDTSGVADDVRRDSR
jgi:hypothetical protein